jgi:hypothetical protein
MITKPTFVGPDFTRRPVKYERFIRPMGLRYKKANVTVSQSFHPNFLHTNYLASGTRCYCSASYNQRKKEPAEPDVHTTRQAYRSANTHKSLLLTVPRRID